MKKLLAAAFVLVLVACSSQKQPKEKVLIAGSFWDSIAIIDKSTGSIEWSMALPQGAECNTVSLTKKGDILFSYKKGARLIDRQGNILWDFAERVDTAEMQTAVELPDGGFMVASCDNPLRIVELDSLGIPYKTVTYNLDIPVPHAQFRAVTKSANGNYLIPVVTRGEVLEINANGELVARFETGGTPFSLIEKENGNLIVSCGDGHNVVEVNRATGEVTELIGQNDLQGITLHFVAGARLLPNGNLMLSNWLGHLEGVSPEVQIVEVDPQKQVVWNFNDVEKKRVKNVSALFPFAE